MWYIQALLIAGLLLVPLIKYHKEGWIVPIGVVLYLFALICGRYYFLIKDCNALKNIVDGYLYWFLSPNNGLFIGFLYTGLGVVAAKLWDAKTLTFRKLQGIDFNVFFTLSTIIFLKEIYTIRGYQGIPGSTFFLTQPLFLFFLFVFSAQFYESPSNPKHNTLLFRDLSISIYVLHPPIQRCFTLVQELSGVHSKLFGNPYSLFIQTLFFTLLICYPIYKRKIKYLYSWLT